MVKYLKLDIDVLITSTTFETVGECVKLMNHQTNKFVLKESLLT